MKELLLRFKVTREKSCPNSEGNDPWNPALFMSIEFMLDPEQPTPCHSQTGAGMQFMNSMNHTGVVTKKMITTRP
jgi:hypothetical protein